MALVEAEELRSGSVPEADALLLVGVRADQIPSLLPLIRSGSIVFVKFGSVGSPGSAATAPRTDRAGLSGLWHDSAERFTDGGRSIALGLATMAPWLLLGLLLFVPGRAIWRRTAPAGTPAD